MLSIYEKQQQLNNLVHGNPDNIQWAYEMYNNKIKIYKGIDNTVHVNLKNDNEKLLQ